MKKLLKVIGCIVVIIALFFLGVIGYFRLSVSSYYKASQKEFLIPSIDDGFVAQGLSYDENTGNFYVCGYMKDGSKSPIFIVNKETKELQKTIYLKNDKNDDFKGHAGGLTVYGDYLYVADSKGLLCYSYSDVSNCEDKGSVEALGLFNTCLNDDDKLGVAYTCVFDGKLFVGEFYREQNYPTVEGHKINTKGGDYNQAFLVGFEFMEGEDCLFGLSKIPSVCYSTTDLVQGAVFTHDKVYLSTSYGVAFSHIYEYDLTKMNRENDVTFLGNTVECYSLDSNALIKDFKIAPMSEEVVIVDGKMYVMCESASNKYIFGKFTGAKYCYSTDMEKAFN